MCGAHLNFAAEERRKEIKRQRSGHLISSDMVAAKLESGEAAAK
jgi:hypothetical protein